MSDIRILQKETYLSMIHNAVGTKMFRDLWAVDLVAGVMDLTENGSKSCAVFVSSVLYLFDLISSKRATVKNLVQDLEASGWKEMDMFPNPGDVVVWEPRKQNGHKSMHIGFYLGDAKAVSNDWKSGTAREHHMTYGFKKNGQPIRKIAAVYTHDFLK